MNRPLKLACLVCCLGFYTGTVSAAEYLYVFAPLEANFAPDLAGNRASMMATLSLLEDYSAAEGVHFVLAGELPAECAAAADCEARNLLKRRVESVTAALGALPDGARLVTLLQWQPIPPAPGGSHVEGLELRLRLDPPAVFSGQCPFELQVTDPRLPAELFSSDHEANPWVSVRGLTSIPVSTAASMRATPAVRNSGAVTASQRTSDHNAILSSGAVQVRWTAEQLTWTGDAADVDIDSESEPRDIGNVILPWNDGQSGDSDAATTVGSCRVHFVLRR